MPTIGETMALCWLAGTAPGADSRPGAGGGAGARRAAGAAAMPGAVAIGMRAAAWLSVRVVGLAPESHVRLEAALDLLGLPVRMPDLPLARLFAAMRHDKKRTQAEVRWVLTPRIGDASVPRAVESRLVRAALMLSGARTARA